MVSPLALLVSGASVVLLSAGFLAGSSTRPEPTELRMARQLHGDNARLIGYLCGDHNATVIVEYEDEFPESGCKEIRTLRDE